MQSLGPVWGAARIEYLDTITRWLLSISAGLEAPMGGVPVNITGQLQGLSFRGIPFCAKVVNDLHAHC